MKNIWYRRPDSSEHMVNEKAGEVILRENPSFQKFEKTAGASNETPSAITPPAITPPKKIEDAPRVEKRDQSK